LSRFPSAGIKGSRRAPAARTARLSPAAMTTPPHPFTALLLAAVLGLAATARLHAGPALASSPVVTFFSSIDGEPFARLEAVAVRPDGVRHGPFRLPAPGLRLESPALTLFDQACNAEDWNRFLRILATWRRPSVADDFLVTLPDGRTFALIELRRDKTRPTLLAVVAPLAPSPAGGAAPERRLLRVEPDAASGRLAITLDPAPEPRAPDAP